MALTRQALCTLDARGRCCGVTPHHYKGGSWRRPPGSPLSICMTCDREYGPDGRQRANFAWDAEGRDLRTPQPPVRRLQPATLNGPRGEYATEAVEQGLHEQALDLEDDEW